MKLSAANFKTALVLFTITFTLSHLAWEAATGGVVSHHFLARADMPSVSNWWELIILPGLAWFTGTQLMNRHDQAPHDPVPYSVVLALAGTLSIAIVQSITFSLGNMQLTMVLAVCLLVSGLILPIYRPEYVLGYVMGSAFTFGPVIPGISIVIMGLISALWHHWLWPGARGLVHRSMPRDQ